MEGWSSSGRLPTDCFFVIALLILVKIFQRRSNGNVTEKLSQGDRLTVVFPQINGNIHGRLNFELAVFFSQCEVIRVDGNDIYFLLGRWLDHWL